MTEDELHKEFALYCEPLFLLDQYLRTGHTESTPNGTITYIKYRGMVYGVTCQHVVQEMLDARAAGKRVQLATSFGKSFTFYQWFDPASEEFVTLFKSPDTGEDIAIAPLGPDMPVGAQNKGKLAYNLDSWQQPDWSKVKLAAAVGFGTEHKAHVEDKVAAPMHVVVAELANTIREDGKVAVFSSVLDKPHNTFFSGLSGGPVFADDDGPKPKLAGIVFEGQPGGKKSWGERKPEESYLTENDIVFKATILTPQRFEEWLKAAGLHEQD